MTILIHNIPNFYSSYYLLSLSKLFDLKFQTNSEFSKFNNRGFIIFSLEDRLVVIDNHDPVGVNDELYKKCHLYFATNKLLDNPSYQQEKVRPLFPHYPVNILPLYLKTFHFHLLTKLKPKDFAREVYVLRKRPDYKNLEDNYHFHPYVFFSGSTWKKETWANQIRAEFIRACKKHPKIEFEGGFIPRSDGNNFGYDEELNTKTYSPKLFSELSAKSLISLNNPAVLGAVSWRLAEYWNASSFVLSFPFAIDLPIYPEEGKEIAYIYSSEEFDSKLDEIINDPGYHEKISRGGKAFFEKYCTPEAQAAYLKKEVLD
ncbi:glycosyltransferase [Algoriphagus formosus]|uniref:glycosyltransferase n=1 Tax=Algoriphagus formosus TaxID=2007308 RepID=UPI000C281EFF|nr:glycosyltransferase [Algoriphagus formosus]